MAPSQRDIALAWLQTLHTLDFDAAIALKTPDCRHTVLPSSMRLPPNMGNQEWATAVSFLKETLAALIFTPKEIVDGSASNQITIWATSEATFKEDAKDDGDDDNGGAVDWNYQGEYMFLFVFNEIGDRIEHIIEFLDSHGAVQAMGLIERAKRNLAR